MAKTLHTGTFTITPALTGPFPVTGVGFQPTGLMVRGNIQTPPTADQMTPFLGVAGSPADQGTAADYDVSARPDFDAASIGDIIKRKTRTGQDLVAELVSFDADGFTLLITANTLTVPFNGLFYAFESV